MICAQTQDQLAQHAQRGRGKGSRVELLIAPRHIVSSRNRAIVDNTISSAPLLLLDSRLPDRV
jgi:MarR-like DNA-binding transcriptional regulator SgrR of sgrS sRNA